MTKSDFVAKLAAKTEGTQAEAAKYVDAFLSLVTESLAGGEAVSFVGFGTFEVKDRPERVGHNPKTGESITVPAGKAPAFKAGKLLKDAVKG